MRRSGIVDRRDDPLGESRNEFNAMGKGGVRRWQVVRRLAGADAIQPHDVTVDMVDLRAVMIVRGELVRLNVSVRDSVGVVDVRFVDMLGRKDPRQGEPWRQNDADREPAE